MSVDDLPSKAIAIVVDSEHLVKYATALCHASEPEAIDFYISSIQWYYKQLNDSVTSLSYKV